MRKFKKGDVVVINETQEQGVITGVYQSCKSYLVQTINSHPEIIASENRLSSSEWPQKEKTCEWVDTGDKRDQYSIFERCDGGKYCDHTLPSYCGQCDGKVVLKERMCSLGGIEFPAPKIMDLDTDILTDSYVELEYKRYEFKNETDRHTFMIALQAAVTQAIEAAK